MGIVRRESVLTSIAAYAGGVLGMVNKLLLLPRIFDEEEVGLTNLLVNVGAMLAQIGTLGFPNVALRFFPFFRDDKNGHNGFLSIGFMFGGLGFLLILGSVLLFKEPFVDYYSKNSALLVDYLPALLIITFCTILFNVMIFYIRSLYKTFVPSLIRDVVLRLLVTGSISLYALDLVDFNQFVIIYTAVNCSIAVMVAVYLIWLGQFHLRLPKLANMPKNTRQILIYGFTVFLSTSSVFFVTNLDSLMLAPMIGLNTAGIYVTVLFITSFMLFPYRALVGVSSPKVAEGWEKNDLKEIGKLYKRVTLMTFTVGIFLYGGILLNLDNIFKILPEVYKPGMYTLIILGAARLVEMTTGLNGIILSTSKKFVWDLVFIVILLVAAFGTNVYFINLMGMTGAAVATLITLVGFNIARVIFVQIQFKMQPLSWPMLWPLISGVGAWGVAWLIPQFDPYWLDLIARSAVFTLLYITFAVWKGYAPDINKFAAILLGKLGINFPKKS